MSLLMDFPPPKIILPFPTLLETLKGLCLPILFFYFTGYLHLYPISCFGLGFLIFHLYQYSLILYSYFTDGIPGPFPFPLFGNLFTTFHLSEASIAHKIAEKWHAKYGNMYRTWSGRTSVIMINDLKILRQMLTSEYNKYDRRIEHWVFHDFLGNGIITYPNGEKWRQTRALLTPAFHHLKLKALFPFIYSKSQKLVSRLRPSKNQETTKIEVHSEFLKLTFDTICLIAFGSDFGALDKEQVPELNAFNFALEHMQWRFYSPFPYWRYIKTKGVQRFEKEKNLLSQSIQNQIELTTQYWINLKQNEEENLRADVLSHILQMKYNFENQNNNDNNNDNNNNNEQETLRNKKLDNEQDTKTKKKWFLSDQDLLDHLLNFLFAGHDTTANLLSWCIYYLARDQDKQEKVVKEILNAMNSDTTTIHEEDKKTTPTPTTTTTTTPLTYDHITQCKYLECVVKEVLRLRPSAPLRSRDINEPQITFYNGSKIKTGGILGWSAWTVHHNPDIWPEPKKFDPDRFYKPTPTTSQQPQQNEDESDGVNTTTKLSSNIPTHLKSYAFIPFGSGPRRCLGAQLAVLEAKVVLATLLSQLKFTLSSEQTDQSENSLTLHPKGGMNVCVSLRS